MCVCPSNDATTTAPGRPGVAHVQVDQRGVTSWVITPTGKPHDRDERRKQRNNGDADRREDRDARVLSRWWLARLAEVRLDRHAHATRRGHGLATLPVPDPVVCAVSCGASHAAMRSAPWRV